MVSTVQVYIVFNQFKNMTIIFCSVFRNSINYVIFCALTLTHGLCHVYRYRSDHHYCIIFNISSLIHWFFYYNDRNNHYLSLKYIYSIIIRRREREAYNNINMSNNVRDSIVMLSVYGYYQNPFSKFYVQ